MECACLRPWNWDAGCLLRLSRQDHWENYFFSAGFHDCWHVVRSVFFFQVPLGWIFDMLLFLNIAICFKRIFWTWLWNQFSSFFDIVSGVHVFCSGIVGLHVRYMFDVFWCILYIQIHKKYINIHKNIFKYYVLSYVSTYSCPPRNGPPATKNHELLILMWLSASHF